MNENKIIKWMLMNQVANEHSQRNVAVFTKALVQAEVADKKIYKYIHIASKLDWQLISAVLNNIFQPPLLE